MPQSTDTQILELLQKMDQRLSNLENTVQHISQLADIAPDGLAMLADTVDGVAVSWADQGIDIDERVNLLVQTVETMSHPATLKLLSTVLGRSSELEPIFKSTLNAMDDAKQTSTSLGFMMRFMRSMGQSLKTA